MSSIRARGDPGTEPLRVHAGFAAEFPDGDASASEVLLNITFTGVVALNRVDELLAPYGLVLKSFNVLAVLDGDPEPLTPTAIGERTLIAKTSVTSVLDSLERLGLAQRRPHPTSRRSILVELTPQGRATCAEVLHVLHRREAQWIAPMPERRRQSLIRLLGEVRGLLNTE
jgi:DNA-binding MarR family transcriptional regulator